MPLWRAFLRSAWGWGSVVPFVAARLALGHALSNAARAARAAAKADAEAFAAWLQAAASGGAGAAHRIVAG